MATKTHSDLKQGSLQLATGLGIGNLGDLEWNFYSINSGLSPASKYSVSDHKLAYYKLQGAAGASLKDVEAAYFRSQGAQGKAYDDLALDFYTNYSFSFNPTKLSGLAAWFDGSNIDNAGTNNANLTDAQALDQWTDLSGNLRHVLATTTKKPLVRKSSGIKNLLSLVDAGFEGGIGTWGSFNQGTGSVAQGSTPATGAQSLLVTPTVTGTVEVFETAFYPVSPSTSYTAEISIRAAGIGNGNCIIYWYNSSNASISQSVGALSGATVGSYVRFSATGTAPANAAYAHIGFSLTGNVSGVSFNVDNAGLYAGSALPTAWVPPVSLPNSKTVIQFDGVDDAMAASTYKQASPFSMFAVVKTDAAVTKQQTALATSGDASGAALQPVGSLASNYELAYPGVADIRSGVGFTTGWHVLEGIDDGVNGTLYVDGASLASSASRPSAPVSTLTVGSQGSANQFLSGAIAEIVIYNRALSATERQQVERYLKSKYGTP